MKKIIRLFVVAGIILGSFAACQQRRIRFKEDLFTRQSDFYNLINIKNVPSKERTYDMFVFSDLGAWSAYALPENESRHYAGAFIGPMSMNGYGWIAKTLAQPIIQVDGLSYDLARNMQTAKYMPGRLLQEYNNEQLNFMTELCFVTPRTVAVRSIVKNVSPKPLKVSLSWEGGVFSGSSVLSVKNNDVVALRLSDSTCTVVLFRTADQVMLTDKDSLRAVEQTDLLLQPNASYQADYTQTVMLREENVQKELDAVTSLDINECFDANEIRWNQWIAALLSGDSKYLNENKYRNVLVKAMMTLNSNLRSPAGDILHAGSNPSYNGFINGIWSWDAWKIASANVLYNPDMAKDEMRTLFDYQDVNGMVPDYISYNKKHNNWRDSKPPLAAWGTMNVYRATGDRIFLEEMFDKLYKFHQWWYIYRDHDHNGICEYGSTDGSLIAAAWESGMDNGVRFDDAVMLKNGEKAWSMNQENICLNSFLYAEKNLLSELAVLLGKKELAGQLMTEAQELKKHIQTKMFDKETGFFYDTRLGTGEFIKVMGAEGWLPLWAGAATQEQAKAVMDKMMDPKRFNSVLPLGTLDISHPGLRPIRGYWRGPVWVDQVYFGIMGLRNYGYDREADFLLEKFIDNAQGLTTDGPIHENYNPLTGERLNCPNFGWSSALIIKMILNK